MKNSLKLLLAFILLSTILPAQQYNWQSVRISGGGNVTSVIFHPKVKDVLYITTDVGTPWRWNTKEQKWEDMMLFDKIPVRYWKAGLSQAALNVVVDPRDKKGNILYAMVENGDPATFKSGERVTGGVLKSYDRGRSWVDCGLPINVQPNYGDKGMTSRIAVDPNNSNVVYVTSMEQGSYVNEKAGEKGFWKKLDTGIADTDAKTGDYNKSSVIKFILLDKSSGKTNGKTKKIYIGHKSGIKVSNDGGKSFAEMQGAPSGAVRATIANDGVMYVSFNQRTNPRKTGIMKWDKKTWQDVTPAKPRFDGQSYKAVDVHPFNSKVLIVSEIGTWLRDKMYISKDGGKTWRTPNFTKIDNSEAPHSHSHDYDQMPLYDNNMFAWDPFRPGEVWYVDMIDVAHTKNIWADSVSWKLQDKGLEEVIVTGPMVAPPFGKNYLLSSTADIGGADHRSLTGILPHGVNQFFFGKTITGTNNSQAAVQWTDPNFIVRIGSDGWSMRDTINSRAGYSLDGGNTYQRFKTYPGVRGRVAISADSRKIVWVTQVNGDNNGEVFWSHDLGNTWTKSIGTDSGILPFGSQWSIAAGANYITADKVNGNTFYLFDRGKLYASTDGGRSFTVRNSNLPNQGNNVNNNNSSATIFANIETTPDKEGDIWIAFQDGPKAGLYHSTDGGFNFEKVLPDEIKSPKWIAIGKDKPNGKTLLFISSNAVPFQEIQYGIFRSDDMGKTWKNIANPAPGTVMNMAADYHGRVFAGINGVGMFFGEPK